MVHRFIETILGEHDYYRGVIKNHFNNNLVMTEKDKQILQKPLPYNKRYRGSVHWSCNINLRLTKKFRLIFHNLRGHDSHLIIRELGKSDVGMSVIPNELQKSMALTINNNSFFYLFFYIPSFY